MAAAASDARSVLRETEYTSSAASSSRLSVFRYAASPGWATCPATPGATKHRPITVTTHRRMPTLLPYCRDGRDHTWIPLLLKRPPRRPINVSGRHDHE